MHAVFSEPGARQKIVNLEGAIRDARAGHGEIPPAIVARTMPIVGIRDLPTREGLTSPIGLARLLHDLASIEMQATELSLRTIIEFPTLDSKFLDELADLTRDEGRHLGMCLDGLAQMGYALGHWPVHIQLWKAVTAEDSILDRLLIVHRYQEGGGLDAGAGLLRKLIGAAGKDCARELDIIQRAVNIIFEDELKHVQFGSRWYRYFFERSDEKMSDTAESDFRERLKKLIPRMPVRRERMDWPLRERAGFSRLEFEALEDVQRKGVL